MYTNNNNNIRSIKYSAPHLHLYIHYKSKIK